MRKIRCGNIFETYRVCVQRHAVIFNVIDALERVNFTPNWPVWRDRPERRPGGALDAEGN